MGRLLRPVAGPLRGRVPVPGDKSISHRVALMAPLAAGPCRARGWLDADDTRRSLEAVRALGAAVERRDGLLTIAAGTFPAAASAAGAATAPELSLDCGNSGTTARLLLGLLAGRRVIARLDGDASLRGRPMARVTDPLAALGARVTWLGEPGRLPLRLEGRALAGGTVRLPVASAQVKSALLLAGLTASGPLTLSGCGATRDHTEWLLRAMGAPLDAADRGDTLTARPAGPLRPFDLTVPGDPSSAAFLLAAALLVPGSEVTVDDVLLNPTRAGFLNVIRRMGADLTIRPRPDDGWEPVGAITVRHRPLRAFTIAPGEVPSLIDELPILAVLATGAAGESTVTGAAELRLKESDRLAAMGGALRALGVPFVERADGFAVRGPCALRAPAAPGHADPGVLLATRGDHRVAMSLAVAALVTDGPVTLDDDACVAISFPDFFAALARLQG
jgi:3-phosphoshikimate 1-carboxyvinyltransferase